MSPRLLLSAFLLLGAAGCVRVSALERGRLADPAMAPPWEGSALKAEYDAKLMETKTGGARAGAAPGGGCGCTQ